MLTLGDGEKSAWRVMVSAVASDGATVTVEDSLNAQGCGWVWRTGAGSSHRVLWIRVSPSGYVEWAGDRGVTVVMDWPHQILTVRVDH